MSDFRGTRLLSFTAMFAVLTYAGSLIKIPVPPVPFTLQMMFVLLSGSLLGPVPGALSQILYLCAGLAGLPVFSYGGGIGYVLNPAFGYLAAFPAGAFTAGVIASRLRKEKNEKSGIWKLALANAAGATLILIVGVLYLAMNMKYIMAVEQFSFSHIIWAGLIIFIPSGIGEVILASFLAQRLRKIMQEILT